MYIAKTLQISFMAIIGATMFLRTRMHSETEEDGAAYVGALLFSLITNMFNGFPELPMAIERLPVLYKHRDLLFHPTWAYTVPTILLRVPISIVESTVWTILTYFVIGFAPEASRFFKHFLLMFLIHQMASGIFRLIAAVCRTMTIANTAVTVILESCFLLGGIIHPKDQIPDGWHWAYWVSPLSYGFNALTTNEFSTPRWMNKLASDKSNKLGVAILQNFGVTPDRNWFWIGAAALLGLAVVFNTLFTLALAYLAAKYLWFFFIHFLTFLYFTYHGLMTVSLTPNDQLASILTSAFYSLFNLFSGFFIPRPKTPKWWIWCYWICPLAWTFQGLIASQYGDVTETIKVPGMSHDPTIKWYVDSHFGYNDDYLELVAAVLVSFTVFFAVMYAYCLNQLNFQTR